MAAQDASIISQFFETADEYIVLRDYLQAQIPKVKGTPLEKETNAILADGEKKRGMMDTVYMSIDNVLISAKSTWEDFKIWISDATSLSGYKQLGALPILIPLAIISAATAATISLKTWITIATTQKAKIEQYEALIKEGVPPLEAANISNQLLMGRAKMGIMEKGILIAGLLFGSFYFFNKRKQ